MKNISPSVALLAAITLTTFSGKPKIVVEGAWKIVEVQTVNADGRVSSSFPKESLALFSKGYYSFTWTTHSSSIRSWNMADSTKLNRFNQSIVNTGTYELKNEILTTTAAFAQNPMFVGGAGTFKCYMIGDTLVLTGQSLRSSDNISHPLYAGGSHVVNKLLRIK